MDFVETLFSPDHPMWIISPKLFVKTRYCIDLTWKEDIDRFPVEFEFSQSYR